MSPRLEEGGDDHEYLTPALPLRRVSHTSEAPSPIEEERRDSGWAIHAEVSGGGDSYSDISRSTTASGAVGEEEGGEQGSGSGATSNEGTRMGASTLSADLNFQSQGGKGKKVGAPTTTAAQRLERSRLSLQLPPSATSQTMGATPGKIKRRLTYAAPENRPEDLLKVPQPNLWSRSPYLPVCDRKWMRNRR